MDLSHFCILGAPREHAEHWSRLADAGQLGGFLCSSSSVYFRKKNYFEGISTKENLVSWLNGCNLRCS